jgi:hypothetical protein
LLPEVPPEDGLEGLAGLDGLDGLLVERFC